MSPRATVDPGVLEAVRGLTIDQDYLCEVVEALTAIGSSPLGFRTTGTDEDVAVAAYVAEQMRQIGLANVAVEDVTVDAWRFLDASVVADGKTYPAVSFGGVTPTEADGVQGRLVDVADGRLRRLARLDLRGAIALLDWRHDDVHPSAVVLELAQRGVLGLVINVPAGAGWYQSPNALGGFDGHWPRGAPPMVLISKEDAVTLRGAAAAPALQIRMQLNATLTLGALGHNVVGYLTGEDAVLGQGIVPPSGPIVIGAHHDAWFRGAFDNTSGVAAMLGLARALVAADYHPRHRFCFTSRTAEEYGVAGSTYDWCIGAWQQVNVTHPDWQGAAPFHLCLEATGHRSLRSVIEAPVELAGWARRIGRVAQREGWTPTGWRISPPVAGTEQWPFLVSGVPGVAAYAWERSFGRTDYHTQFDTVELLDFEVVEAQTRLYALLLLEADRDPVGILDHTARGRQLAEVAAGLADDGLAAAAQAHAGVTGRGPFTVVGRGMFALDAHGAMSLPHEQLARDAAAIESALAALTAGDPRGAGRALRAIGGHGLVGYLGPAAFAAHRDRYGPAALTRTWASASHLTVSQNVLAELACLTRQPGANTFGPWVEQGLRRALAVTRLELSERVDTMTQVLIHAGLPEQATL